MKPSHLSIFLALIFIVALVLAAFSAIAYFNQIGWQLPSEISELGTLGDFFGGTLNPVFGLLSLLAILLTIVLQSKELEATRLEMAQARVAAEQQVKVLEKQLEISQQGERELNRIRVEEKKAARTAEFIDQFFSYEFIGHRVALWNMRQSILDKKASITFVANGYLYPIHGGCYEGNRDEWRKLTEHEHLTLYLGYMERLGNALIRDELDKQTLRSALSYESRWHADLLRFVSLRVISLAEEREVQCPTFAGHVISILDILNIEPSGDEINSNHVPMLSEEDA